MEENTTCDPDASTSHAKALRLLLIGLIVHVRRSTLHCGLSGGSIGPSVPLRRESPMTMTLLILLVRWS